MALPPMAADAQNALKSLTWFGRDCDKEERNMKISVTTKFGWSAVN